MSWTGSRFAELRQPCRYREPAPMSARHAANPRTSNHGLTGHQRATTTVSHPLETGSIEPVLKGWCGLGLCCGAGVGEAAGHLDDGGPVDHGGVVGGEAL